MKFSQTDNANIRLRLVSVLVKIDQDIIKTRKYRDQAKTFCIEEQQQQNKQQEITFWNKQQHLSCKMSFQNCAIVFIYNFTMNNFPTKKKTFAT